MGYGGNSSPKKLRKFARTSVKMYQHLGFEDNRGKLHKRKWVAKASSFLNFVGGLFKIIFSKNARRITKN